MGIKRNKRSIPVIWKHILTMRTVKQWMKFPKEDVPSMPGGFQDLIII